MHACSSCATSSALATAPEKCSDARNRDALLVAAGAAAGATLAALLRPFVIAKLRERLYRARFDQHASRSPILLRILRLLTADETRLKDQIAVKRDLPPAVVDEML